MSHSNDYFIMLVLVHLTPELTPELTLELIQFFK